MTKEGDRLLRPLGLTDAQFNILMLLKYQSESGRINQTQLGQMLLVNRSNVTGLVDRMEQAGWVERTAESGDRRVKMVQLTPSGRKLLERAEKAYYLRVDEIMGGLSANEVRQLCRLLERIRLQLKPINQAD
jgi:DNA-binding MarR family transcriptional regulator